MIDNEKKFKKNPHVPCPCSNLSGLFVPNRLLSALCAAFLFIFFSTFITGYFLGKRNEAQQIIESMTDNAFVDQVYASALSINEVNEVDEQELVKQIVNEIDHKSDVGPNNISTETIRNSPKVTERHCAQLIGFGTQKAAQKFAEKLISKGISVEVVTRSSKTAKGHTVQWYQVITAAFDNKDELMELVHRLVKEERLKDVRVLTSSNI